MFSTAANTNDAGIPASFINKCDIGHCARGSSLGLVHCSAVIAFLGKRVSMFALRFAYVMLNVNCSPRIIIKKKFCLSRRIFFSPLSPRPHYSMTAFRRTGDPSLMTWCVTESLPPAPSALYLFCLTILISRKGSYITFHLLNKILRCSTEQYNRYW